MDPSMSHNWLYNCSGANYSLDIHNCKVCKLEWLRRSA